MSCSALSLIPFKLTTLEERAAESTPRIRGSRGRAAPIWPCETSCVALETGRLGPESADGAIHPLWEVPMEMPKASPCSMLLTDDFGRECWAPLTVYWTWP